MKLELTRKEMYALLTALDNEAENNLKLIKDDCDCEVHTSEVYVNEYLKNLNLIKKIEKTLEENKDE